MDSLIKFSLLAIVLVSGVSADDSSTNDLVNLSSDQIAKLRKFRAENHYVTSEDGYILNLVYIPAVRPTNKRPVIFNHGTTQSSTYFMTNSVGARPRDLSQSDAGSMSQSELEQLLADDPTATCFPLLLSIFGHDVWLVNRRGTEYSLGKTSRSRSGGILQRLRADGHNFVNGIRSRMWDLKDGLMDSLNPFASGGQVASSGGGRQQDDSGSSGLLGFLKIFLRPQLNLASIPNTLDSGYWNFSLDEQARYDLPAIINYVLKETKSDKVAYVGHSIGNVLMFMLQSEQPEWADKVEPFLAWSPDIYLGNSTSQVIPLLSALQPILTNTQMPFPPTPLAPLTRTLLASLCQTRLAQDTVCRLLQNGLWGQSEDQQLTLPAFVASQFYAVSSHEAATLPQTHQKGRLHKFDYGNAAANLRAYGQEEPPRYNVSRIRSRSISLWRGERDSLATPSDVDLFKKDLSVSVDDRFITEVPFNHYCLMFGRNVTTLVNIPSLKLIGSYR